MFRFPAKNRAKLISKGWWNFGSARETVTQKPHSSQSLKAPRRSWNQSVNWLLCGMTICAERLQRELTTFAHKTARFPQTNWRHFELQPRN
jgi:hypothetical protein